MSRCQSRQPWQWLVITVGWCVHCGAVVRHSKEHATTALSQSFIATKAIGIPKKAQAAARSRIESAEQNRTECRSRLHTTRINPLWAPNPSDRAQARSQARTAHHFAAWFAAVFACSRAPDSPWSAMSLQNDAFKDIFVTAGSKKRKKGPGSGNPGDGSTAAGSSSKAKERAEKRKRYYLKK